MKNRHIFEHNKQRKNTIMSNFGKTIHNLRTRRKMTQQELAQDLFDRSTISKIENTELSTTYENEIKLITRLGLTPNEFEYISNSYQVGTKNQLLYRFLNLDGNVDQEEINGLLQDCLFVKNDEDIKRIAIILKSLLLVNKATAPAHARIAICQNDKQTALDQISLLQKIGAAKLAKSLKQEVKEFL